jgi:hypothetical protein
MTAFNTIKLEMTKKCHLNVFRSDLHVWDGAFYETFEDAVEHMKKCQAYGDKQFIIGLQWVTK